MASSQASSYERGNDIQRLEGMYMIENLEIKKGSTILDLGCGTGGLTRELAELVGAEGKVVGVDPDEERLKIAKEKYSASNIEFFKADDKTFPTGQYDIVFCNVVIHWIKDKEELHRRVYDNLRPGGVFAFVALLDGAPALPEIGVRLFTKFVGPEFVHRMLNEVMTFVSPNEYERLARVTGFELKSAVVREREIKLPSLDNYIDAIYGWSGSGGKFDPSSWDKDALEEIKKEHGDGPVVAEEPLNYLHVIISKPTERWM